MYSKHDVYQFFEGACGFLWQAYFLPEINLNRLSGNNIKTPTTTTLSNLRNWHVKVTKDNEMRYI